MKKYVVHSHGVFGDNTALFILDDIKRIGTIYYKDGSKGSCVWYEFVIENLSNRLYKCISREEAISFFPFVYSKRECVKATQNE